MIDEAPLKDSVTIKDGILSVAWTSWFKKVGLYCGAVSDSGTTANRPDKNLWIGRPYFDTTLGYIIHIKTVSPVVWVDGAGTTV